MAKPLVSVYQDVEDPINPLADDAALDFARLFTECGVRGSFCITGEKCRTLLDRGRTDVLDALRSHCLGLHTDTHSFHPTTMELLADLSFEEGCVAAYEAEAPGLAAFVAAFGRSPAFWGGAGNTWSPEITDALKRLGIPAYAYALTALPGDPIHRFNGVTALTQNLSVSETDWADDERAAVQSENVLARLGSRPYTGIFIGHPTKFRYAHFWDVPYAAGRTPPVPEYTEPLSDETYERSMRNLAAFLRRLAAAATILGVDEALNLSWQFRGPSEGELEFFRTQTAQNLRDAIHWPIHRPGLSSERIVAKTLALSQSVELGMLRQA